MAGLVALEHHIALEVHRKEHRSPGLAAVRVTDKDYPVKEGKVSLRTPAAVESGSIAEAEAVDSILDSSVAVRKAVEVEDSLPVAGKAILLYDQSLA